MFLLMYMESFLSICIVWSSTVIFSNLAGEEDTPIGAMPGCYRLGWRYGLVEEVIMILSIQIFPKELTFILISCSR